MVLHIVSREFVFSRPWFIVLVFQDSKAAPEKLMPVQDRTEM